MSSLRITEIFYSLQGESNTVGLPTVFIRLTGCPLRCTYCDTAYAFTGGERISITDIVAQTATYGTKYVTVTGGEPLAQVGCIELIEQLLASGFFVSLETSGALDVSKVDARAVKVLDFKTPSSGELSKNLYQNIDFLTIQDQIKFVIGTDEDYEWSKELVAKYKLDERFEVLFSPVMGLQNPTELAEKILRDKLQVRFQIQLHKLLWDDAQGK
ncbi:MAG: 7-carboxy-7-deazaguanine synthase QueE [Methylococcales bacterium]|nr:7-carboxy-7-deazaguanine synthase QueE [Methylococcales bacterium]